MSEKVKEIKWHNTLHVCKQKIKRIKELTKNPDIHGVSDDLLDVLYEFFYEVFDDKLR